MWIRDLRIYSTFKVQGNPTLLLNRRFPNGLSGFDARIRCLGLDYSVIHVRLGSQFRHRLPASRYSLLRTTAELGESNLYDIFWVFVRILE